MRSTITPPAGELVTTQPWIAPSENEGCCRCCVTNSCRTLATFAAPRFNETCGEESVDMFPPVPNPPDIFSEASYGAGCYRITATRCTDGCGTGGDTFTTEIHALEMKAILTYSGNYFCRIPSSGTLISYACADNGLSPDGEHYQEWRLMIRPCGGGGWSEALVGLNAAPEVEELECDSVCLRTNCCDCPCPDEEHCELPEVEPFYFSTCPGANQIVVCQHINPFNSCAWSANVVFEWSYTPDFATIEGVDNVPIGVLQHGECPPLTGGCNAKTCACGLDFEDVGARFYRATVEWYDCDCNGSLSITLCPGGYYQEGQCPDCVDAECDNIVCCQGDGNCNPGTTSCNCESLHGFVSEAEDCLSSQCHGACCLSKEGQPNICLDELSNWCDPIPVEVVDPNRIVHDTRIGRYDCQQMARNTGATWNWTPGETCCDVDCTNCGCHNLRFNPSFSANGLFVCPCIRVGPNDSYSVQLLHGGFEGLKPEEGVPCTWTGQVGRVRISNYAPTPSCNIAPYQVTDCNLQMYVNVEDCILVWSLQTADCTGGGGDIIAGGTVTGQECGGSYEFTCPQTEPDCNALDFDSNPLGVECSVVRFNFSGTYPTPCI